MSDSDLERIREFVHLYQNIPDLQFKDPPVDLHSHQGVTYLLMTASINQQISALQVRNLMHNLFRNPAEKVFNTSFEGFSRWFENTKNSQEKKHGKRSGWKMYHLGPQVFTDVLEVSRACGDLVEWGRNQQSPEAAVQYLSSKILHFGAGKTSARKKAWMFMRWMVRPHPDLGIWQSTTMQPSGLKVPLDVNTGKAFLDLTHRSSLRERFQALKNPFEIDDRGLMASTATNVERVTEVARWILPDDPAGVDYAFFTYGRRGEQKNASDIDRCNVIVGCTKCPLKEVVKCKGI